MKALLTRVALVLFGGLVLALAYFVWVQGAPERGRLARLKAEGTLVPATIAGIDIERRPATSPTGETIRGKYETYRMARVRYTLGGVTFTPAQRFELAGDQANLEVGSPFTVAVVFAEATADVADAVRLAAAHRVPVIPYGAGSSLEGHLLAVLPPVIAA